MLTEDYHNKIKAMLMEPTLYEAEEGSYQHNIEKNIFTYQNGRHPRRYSQKSDTSNLSTA